MQNRKTQATSARWLLRGSLVLSALLVVVSGCKGTDKSDGESAAAAVTAAQTAADSATAEPEPSASEEAAPEMPPDTSEGGGVPVAEDFEAKAAEAVPVDQAEAEVNKIESEINNDKN